MKKAIADIIKVTVILIIAAGLFYVVYPKYEFEADRSEVAMWRYNKITGQAYMWRGEKTRWYWVPLSNWGTKTATEIRAIKARHQGAHEGVKEPPFQLEPESKPATRSMTYEEYIEEAERRDNKPESKPEGR